MSNTPPDSWTDWIQTFRERFIAKQGWTEKEAKLRIRDAWACCPRWRVHVLANDGQRPAGAVPVFEMLTPGGWKLPIQILDRLTGLVAKAMSSQRSPRDIVLGLLSQADHADGQDESDEIKQKRHKQLSGFGSCSTPARTRRLPELSGATSSGRRCSTRFKAGRCAPSSNSTTTRSF